MSTDTVQEDFATLGELASYVDRKLGILRLPKRVNSWIGGGENRGLYLNLFYNEEDYTPKDVSLLKRINAAHSNSIKAYLSYAKFVAERDGFKLVRSYRDRAGQFVRLFREDDPLSVVGIGDFDITTTDRADRFVQMVEREYKKLDSLRGEVIEQTHALG